MKRAETGVPGGTATAAGEPGTADPAVTDRHAWRALRLAAIGAICLPLLIFGWIAWRAHDNAVAEADERIRHALDVQQEHALKMLQAGELVMEELAATVSGLDDATIRAREPDLHARLKAMTERLPGLQSVWLLDATGYPLVSDKIMPVPHVSLADRDYFRGALEQPSGTVIGAVLRPRVVEDGTSFFSLARRRIDATGRLLGVGTVSLLPADFERFYAKLARDDSQILALQRTDGAVLARWPALPPEAVSRRSDAFAAALARAPEGGWFDSRSPNDAVARRIGYRALPGYPIVVVAGISTDAIRARWQAELIAPALLGLPALALLAGALAVALQRTRRLQAESARRLQAETALQEARKLEAIGRLTAGIAHDFNNLLTAISGNVELALLRPEAAAQGPLPLALRAVERAAALTAKLLAIARRQHLALEPLDLGLLLAGMSDLLRHSTGPDITIALEPDSALWPVMGDRGQIEMAILNLALNARDAMPSGGRLTVAAHNGDPSRRPPDLAPGDYAVVTVEDTGTGMAPAVAARAFEPFFTTKAAQGGSGLGLPQVYGIARQCGGTAVIDSRPGAGTRVSLWLPRAAAAPAPPPAPPTAAAAAAGPRLHVLVADDEPAVLAAAAEMLRALGHRVTTAESGAAALAALAAEPPDLLLTDVTMPGLGGIELAARARAQRPGLPVLLMTGYSDVAAPPGLPLIAKPFRRSDLAAAVARAATAATEPAPAAG